MGWYKMFSGNWKWFGARMQSLSLETKLRLFDSLVLSLMLYGVESWSVSAQMKHLVNFFATSAYRIMTGVKRLDKVYNTTVLCISLQE